MSETQRLVERKKTESSETFEENFENNDDFELSTDKSAKNQTFNQKFSDNQENSNRKTLRQRTTMQHSEKLSYTNLSDAISSTTGYGTIPTISKSSAFVVENYPKTYFTRKQFIIVLVSCGLLISSLIVTLTVGLPRLELKRQEYFAGEFYQSEWTEKVYFTVAVLVSGNQHSDCSQIGKDLIIKNNGSVVDAALASLFCSMLSAPHLVSMDSGFRMLAFVNRTTYAIDSEEMRFKIDEHSNKTISVSSMVAAALKIHQKFGKVEFSKIIDPVIELASQGVNISKSLAKYLQQNKSRLQAKLKPMIRNQFFVEQNNQTDLLVREIYRNEKLAKTLSELASKNNSKFLDNLIEDIEKNLISIKMNYSQNAMQNLKSFINNSSSTTIHFQTNSIPFLNDTLKLIIGPTEKQPFYGVILGQILKILENLNLDSELQQCDSEKTIKERAQEFHKILETFKFSLSSLEKFQKNQTNIEMILNNENIKRISAQIEESMKNQKYQQEREYYGFDSQDIKVKQRPNHNAQIIVYDNVSGDVVTLTTSQERSLFEEMDDKFISNQTGIISDIYDNQPAKQSAEKNWPTLVLGSDGQVKIAMGATNGQDYALVQAVAQVLYKILFDCKKIKTAIDESRLFVENQERSFYEPRFPQIYIDLLFRQFQHFKLEPTFSKSVDTITAVHAVLKMNEQSEISDKLESIEDHREDSSLCGQ